MATIRVDIDDSKKAAADSLFASLGLDTSTAVRLFINLSLENNSLPFNVDKLIPNDDLLEAIEDTRNRRNLIGPFDTVDEAMKSLLSD